MSGRRRSKKERRRAQQMANGNRVLDLGGEPDPEVDFEYDGRVLVIFAVDPGVTTGWAALKVPVGRLASGGVAQTLACCRWQHGQILRSVQAAEGGPMALRISDSRHVDSILSIARRVWSEWVTPDDPEDEASWGWDQFVMVTEGFGLRMMSMDPFLLAPERINSILVDRLYSVESEVALFFQSPSEALTTVTDARLRSWAMYDPSSGPHARDADRHAILFLRKFAASWELRKSLGFEELSKWA